MIADATRRVISAWTVPGINPAYHEAVKSEVRAAWPTLAAALDNLEQEVNKQ